MASVKALAKKPAEQEGRSLSNYLEQLVLRDAGEHGIAVVLKNLEKREIGLRNTGVIHICGSYSL